MAKANTFMEGEKEFIKVNGKKVKRMEMEQLY